jgi:hypothetical protein
MLSFSRVSGLIAPYQTEAAYFLPNRISAAPSKAQKTLTVTQARQILGENCGLLWVKCSQKAF